VVAGGRVLMMRYLPIFIENRSLTPTFAKIGKKYEIYFNP